MGVKNTVFFLDLKTLDKKIDKELKEFAKSEELEEKDVVKIIYNEARRIGEKDKVKVTFKIIDGDEDGFRVIVEPASVKYKVQLFILTIELNLMILNLSLIQFVEKSLCIIRK